MQRILTYWAAITSLPIVYVVGKYLVPPLPPAREHVTISGGKRSSYSPGSVRKIREGRTALFVRETPSGQISSFSAKCTHLGCIVEYRESDEKIHCNCHGSVFDLNGNNLSGPATRPLQPYRVEIRNDEVIITDL